MTRLSALKGRSGRREGPSSTFNGAAVRRAVHVRYERPPVLDDDWALRLIDRKSRLLVRVPPLYRKYLAPQQLRSKSLFAYSISNLRLAEELVEQGVASGRNQYLLLGAGLDSFGVRRDDLADRLRVYELDHPVAQAVKRQRIMRARGSVPAHLELVPIDFETTTIAEALAASGHDAGQPSTVSWLNTIAYLTVDATTASLRGLGQVSAPDSRLIFNYPPNTPASPDGEADLAAVRASVARKGEPFRSAYDPHDMERHVADAGFVVEQHLTETDLDQRFFAGRTDDLRPTLPARTIVARRV
ncbi:MAG: class I SAM-dependent methyltransferase [Acidimicrobiales bacterium]